METNPNIIRLLEMLESPEAYSEQEIRDNAWKLSNAQVRRAAAQQAVKAVNISADDFDQG